MKEQKISNQVIVFTDDQSYFENVTVILTEDGPVIVDAFKLPSQFEYVQNFIQKNGYNKPLIQIYTHWHADHTLGNQKLNYIRVIGHRKTLDYINITLREAIKERLIPAGLVPIDTNVFAPTETFENDKVLSVGGINIQLIHAPGHTTDSVVVYLPNQQILIAGDNIVGPEVEFFFPPVLPSDKRTNIDSLSKIYNLIKKLQIKTLIPGHGWILPFSEMIALNEHRYKMVLKSAKEIIERGFNSFLNLDSNFEEQIVRSWLTQANTCMTMEEQEVLKVNISKVLNNLSKEFDHRILYTNLS